MKQACPKYFYFLCLIFLMATSGCVSLSPEDLATANYGFYPDDYQKILFTYFLSLTPILRLRSPIIENG